MWCVWPLVWSAWHLHTFFVVTDSHPPTEERYVKQLAESRYPIMTTVIGPRMCM